MAVLERSDGILIEVGGSQFGQWELPNSPEKLSSHLRDLAQSSDSLFKAIFDELQKDFEISDVNSFSGFPVTPLRGATRGLRSDVPFDVLVETAAVICSVETYLRITYRDGWTVAAYKSWLRRMLAEAIFRPPQAN